MDTAWREAARQYSQQGEADKTRYWAGLGPRQQAMLKSSLKEIKAVGPHPTPEAGNKPRPSGCGRGCAKLLGRGCLVTFAAIAMVTLWSNFPWLSKPATDRFALWPASTRDAMASKGFVEQFLQKVELRKQYAEDGYFPIHVLRKWLENARIKKSDVTAVSILDTVQDGGGWWFDAKKLEGDYNEISSAVAIVELSAAAPEVSSRLPMSEGTFEILHGTRAFGFDQPVRVQARDRGPAVERWYLAMPKDTVLIIGGRTGVEQVLATAAGERDGIRTRRVMRPLLKTIEDGDEIYFHSVSMTQERSIPVVSWLLSRIPGIDLLYSYRAQARVLIRLPDESCIRTVAFQYKTRASAQFHRIALWAVSLTAGPDDVGYEVSGGPGLAAFTESAPCSGAATSWESLRSSK